MNRWVSSWENFWFKPASSKILAVMRVLVASTVIAKTTGLYGLYRIAKWKVVLPWTRVLRPEEWVESGKYVPKLPALAWVPNLDPAVGAMLTGVMLALGVAMFIGLATRVVVPSLTLILGWTMFHTSLDYRHHENVMFWTLVALSFAPSADWYSFDAWLFPTLRKERPVVHQRMLQVLVTVIYLSSFLGKLDWGWWSGAAMRALHEADHFRGPFWRPIWHLIGPVGLSRFTLVAEGLCAFGFWIPRLRWPAALVGATLHVGIDLMMPVTTFSFQMISLYAVFLDPAEAAGTAASAVSAGKRAFARAFLVRT